MRDGIASLHDVGARWRRRARRVSVGIGFSLAALATTGLAPVSAEAPMQRAAWSETGRASFYGDEWQGRRTASGERFDNNALTAAHAWLPFGTRVRVLAENTGREVVVTVTDRIGTPRRVIDLSQQAARRLGFLRAGITEVKLQPD